MATGNTSTCDIGSSPPDKSPNKWDVDNFSGKMDTLMEYVLDIKKGQDNLRKSFDSKIDKLRNDLLVNIDQKIKLLRDEVTLDICGESTRIDRLLSTVQSIQQKVDTVEKTWESLSSNTVSDHPRPSNGGGNPLNDPDLTIIANGLHMSDNENILDKAQLLIAALGVEVSNDVTVTGAIRLPARFDNSPALVKISFRSLDEKILVLRNKMTLRNIEQYKHVYLKSSKSHAERLIELNARALLRELPHGNDRFRIDANGRIQYRTARRAPPAAASTNIPGRSGQAN